jgi:hypothetical protein
MSVASVGFTADVPMVSPPGQVECDPVFFYGGCLVLMEEMCQAGNKVSNNLILLCIFLFLAARKGWLDVKISLCPDWGMGEWCVVWRE